jgi:integrase
MKVPKYRKHTVRNIGFVQHKGKRHYLPGKHKSAESRAAYQAFVSDHILNAATLPMTRSGTLANLCLQYLSEARRRVSASQYDHLRRDVERLLKMFPSLNANEFGPLQFRELQQSLINERIENKRTKKVRRHSKSYIDAICARVRTMIRWGVSYAIVSPVTLTAIETVPGVPHGLAPASKKRKPANMANVEKTIEQMARIPADMTRLQLLTGARSDSICRAELSQFDFESVPGVWLWRPRHKNEHRDQELIIALGPQAQKLLQPYVKKAKPGYPLFPAERSNDGTVGFYAVRSLRQAVVRAAARAKVPQWTPHQLRHAKGHETRAKHGIEATQAVLGHKSLKASEIYSARMLEKAIEIARESG